jgi:2-oxoglutarate ferredoxin oxidoreductase subunit alpha
MGTDSVFTYIVGGVAGAGVKKAGSAASNLFSSMGRHVFQMDDYPSLIRGGHNFVAVSSAVRRVTSHYMKANLVVALDARSYETHRDHTCEGGIIVYNSDEVSSGNGVGVAMTQEAAKHPDSALRIGVSGPAALAAAVGLSRDELREFIGREYKRDLEHNLALAGSIYDSVAERVGGKLAIARGDRARPMLTGNQAIALGSCAAGLDVYLAYPMTPATTVLHFLAAHGDALGVTVMHPESELAAANIAIGAAAAGARAAVGTSGGGFALMEEAFSLAGMAEVPVLFIMSSRPGPSTGVPTYTEQADLLFTLNQGHGDFARIVASPGSVEEAFALAAEMMALVWRFQVPGVLLTEKHLSESRVTVEIDPSAAAWAEPVMHEGGDYRRYRVTGDGVSPLLFPPSPELINWSSYEHDELGITTEEAGPIALMHDKRDRKLPAIVEHLKGMRTVNRYGSGEPVIFTYGSTTLSVLEALAAAGIDATVVQPVYLAPFPIWELSEFAGSTPIVVEQSSTAQFATLLSEKLRLDPAHVIRRYDGRPFEPLELAADIAAALA